ncbi:zinc-binding alcohol dehydrogenase [Planococcus shenhongbingii]|uniref:Zinc-binding alcohol dehydrogenase n=1 Tax=Planococcus shenhongbingii TaxID=3058398 RepID=A0ABT8NG45_9BACL|nr:MULTISPECIES: zinc-binding alcohol dehydrogenase [unclassified Planococcus (in: firmicutes)]MDN7246455.1 zinc-binding alcohol dehydrogenase [Planococcus sp. N017]WKA59446.1 zinc-binding alcohol dehydrogenase [Planococcus sp. N016]
MKKLVAIKPRVAALIDYEDRPVLPNEVKIAVEIASPKHGTEVADFRGQSPFMEEEFSEEWRMFMPRKEGSAKGIVFGEFPLGNMIVGCIIETGPNVTKYEIGDLVCTYGPIMETLIVDGINNPRLRKMPEGAKWQNAICYDPAQFALSGVRDAHVRAGDYAVVVGLGAIGQIAVQLAKRAGAILVIAVDPLAHRRKVALRNGADAALDPQMVDAGFEIKKLTNKLGADAIIETSGNAAALQGALKGIGYGGIISYVAFGKTFPEGLNFGREAHFNNAKIVFSRAASEPNPDYPRWNRKRIEDTCWELLMSGHLNCEDIIDPIIPFQDSAEAYIRFVDQHPELSIKMAIDLKQESFHNFKVVPEA